MKVVKKGTAKAGETIKHEVYDRPNSKLMWYKRSSKYEVRIAYDTDVAFPMGTALLNCENSATGIQVVSEEGSENVDESRHVLNALEPGTCPSARLNQKVENCS